MTDCQTLIDAPTWAFIEKTNAACPENTAALSVAEQRAIHDRMCAAGCRLSPEHLPPTAIEAFAEDRWPS